MLCCVCLLDDIDIKAVCYVQGTSVCRSHAIALGKLDLAGRLQAVYKLLQSQASGA